MALGHRYHLRMGGFKASRLQGVCVCVCMYVCVCMMCVGVSVYACVCLAFRVMLNGMTKVATPLLASSSRLGRPIGAPRAF